nr:hypothetical protein [Methanocalculus alkaliphilus]
MPDNLWDSCGITANRIGDPVGRQMQPMVQQQSMFVFDISRKHTNQVLSCLRISAFINHQTPISFDGLPFQGYDPISEFSMIPRGVGKEMAECLGIH